jgi:hypothetical protein
MPCQTSLCCIRFILKKARTEENAATCAHTAELVLRLRTRGMVSSAPPANAFSTGCTSDRRARTRGNCQNVRQDTLCVGLPESLL